VHLSEEISSHMFFQAAFFSDEIEKIFTWIRSFHNDDVRVMPLVAVNERDHTVVEARHCIHKANLKWNPLSVHLLQRERLSLLLSSNLSHR